MIENKKSFRRFFIDNNDDHLIKDNCIIDDINKTSLKEMMMYLPSQLNKINISKDDTYIGSKSTRASSKKTHNRFNLLANKNKTTFNPNENILFEKKIGNEGLSIKTKNIIINIEKSQKEKLINDNKKNIINDERFSLLK